jgi:hypothetical protein
MPSSTGCKANAGELYAFFIGRPQQMRWAIATLPHLAQRYPAMLDSVSLADRGCPRQSTARW